MGTKRAETFYRIVFIQLPLTVNVLGLGEKRLQSLGTFYNGAKKLEQIFGKKKSA